MTACIIRWRHIYTCRRRNTESLPRGEDNSVLLVVENRQMRFDVYQRMNNICFKHQIDVTWEKDGVQLDGHRHSYKFDKGRQFIIYDVNEVDKGYYIGIGRQDGLKKYSLKMEIETLHLYGPGNIYLPDGKNKQKTYRVRPSPLERTLNLVCCSNPSNHQLTSEEETWTTIWTSGINKDKPCYVLAIKSIITLSKSSHDIFKLDAERKLLFYTALLLSKNHSIERNTKEAQSLLNVAEKFFPDFSEYTLDECFLAANQWVDCIFVSQGTATFVNDDVEMVTLWTLLQNCRIPRDVVEYIFDNRLTSLCMKYFRLQGYNRHENETCIHLPYSLEDKYLKCLIEEYILKMGDDINFRSITEIEGDYDQRTCPIFECIMYCCFIINKGSKELISRYFRTSGYLKKKDECIICVPVEVTRNLIKRLGIDVVVHQTTTDTSCHQVISEIFRIPEEILKWDLEARQRFLENFKRGNVPVYRARCMIVGCAGAGKTTLLRNLQRKENKESRQPPESTKGIDVYENRFIIDSSKDGGTLTLYDYDKETTSNVGCFRKRKKKQSDDPHFLSVMDFAGQVAYYACHQVYFSRRAIYLLVVDMSQDLDTKIGSIKGNNVKGSLFENWSLKDYFPFWLQTIRTYSEGSSSKNVMLGKDDSGSDSSPVIVIATHKDCIQTVYGKDASSFDGEFRKRLLKEIPKTIPCFFNDKLNGYYELELPQKKKTKSQLQAIEDVRRRIARTATSLPHWGEQIPATWLEFEKVLQEKKETKILSRDDMKTLKLNDDDLDNMLRFYHEIGIILFFPDEHLRNTIIVDIQWFVDSFKCIITDEKHVPQTSQISEVWDEFNKSGLLPESLMLDIWCETGCENLYVENKHKITAYMEKLGIMAKRKLSKDDGTLSYYIPSVNKIDLQRKDFIEQGNCTSILTLYFKPFLPHFFFYRLVVALFGIWKPAGDDMLMKNTAIFDAGKEDEYHHVVVAVNKTSIQLQVYTRTTTIPLMTEKIREIRKQVEERMSEITSTFHKKSDYEIGFHCPCKPVKIADEDEECFISEKVLLKSQREILCPNHKHCATVIKREDLLNYWT